MLRRLAATVLICSSAGAVAQQADSTLAIVDPLTATIDYRDAQRFAELWKRTGGQPSAAQIQSDYIQSGGHGVRIFTPNRIIDAANMEKQIAANRGLYQQAVGTCLEWIPDAVPDLRSIYLAMRGLLPEKPLPQIYIVFGGANSGGTAGPGAQVLGLEILCRDARTRPQFRESLRGYFAHETIHTFQKEPPPEKANAEPLLRQMLVEGGADYIASLVTGGLPNPDRDAFARAHEAEIWAQFVKDRAIANRGFDNQKGFTKAGESAFSRWFYSDQGLPAGWKPDMGYWLGLQIAKAYVERAADPHAAIRELLALDDPAEILAKSGYAARIRSVR